MAANACGISSLALLCASWRTRFGDTPSLAC